MSLVVETRPDRALYNVEVSLRMVDQLLAELGGEPLPIPTSPCEQSVIDRVLGALALVASLEIGDSQAKDSRSGLCDRLRIELRALLRELPRSGAGTAPVSDAEGAPVSRASVSMP